jgi:hypothetical protein
MDQIANELLDAPGPAQARSVQKTAVRDPLLQHWVPAENSGKPRKSTLYHPVILKLALLSQGLKVSPEAADQIGKTLKVAHAVGAVGKHALDIILDPGKVYVGLPVGAAVSEHLTKNTPFTLELDDGKYFIGRKPAVLSEEGRWQCVDEDAKSDRLMSVTIPPYPHYYDHKMSRQHSMRSIMPLAGDFAAPPSSRIVTISAASMRITNTTSAGSAASTRTCSRGAISSPSVPTIFWKRSPRRANTRTSGTGPYSPAAPRRRPTGAPRRTPSFCARSRMHFRTIGCG